MEYAGLVDASAVIYMWPSEIATKYRLCIISGPDDSPMFSTFSSSSQCANPFGVQDIIMRCHHSHFTLLKPLGDDGVGGGTIVSSISSAVCVLLYLIYKYLYTYNIYNTYRLPLSC